VCAWALGVVGWTVALRGRRLGPVDPTAASAKQSEARVARSFVVDMGISVQIEQVRSSVDGKDDCGVISNSCTADVMLSVKSGERTSYFAFVAKWLPAFGGLQALGSGLSRFGRHAKRPAG
jgi:hypothetical protein